MNIMSRGVSIARTSDLGSEYVDQLDSLAFQRRESVMPKPKNKMFKLKTYTKNKIQKKAKLTKELPDDVS